MTNKNTNHNETSFLKSKVAKKAVISAHIDIEIPFYDVDMMRIVWHGKYVKYIEDARCVLLDKIAYNYLDMDSSGYLWPIVDMRLKYVASAKFQNNIRVFAHLVEYETRLKIEYEIYDLNSKTILTRAHTVQVAICSYSEEMLHSSPKVFIEKVESCLKGRSQ
jgi:acyl-CoA thioester hydrolase